jgi:hypothetical protein
MLTVVVKFEDRASPVLARLRAGLEDRAALHDAMAGGVEALVKRHLRENYVSRSQATGFYGRMAEATFSSSDAESGTVTVGTGIRGASLRYFGGTVRAGKTISSITGKPTRLLAIPTKDVPVAGSTREVPRNMGVLKYLPSKRGGGVLVEGVMVTGKRSGRPRVERRTGGRLLYILKASVDHKPDRNLLPADAELGDAAAGAARMHVEGLLDMEGGAAS